MFDCLVFAEAQSCYDDGPDTGQARSEFHALPDTGQASLAQT